jgi:hypothetical protein
MEVKKALYPSDFSPESVISAKAAIDYCIENNIELFLLHTYRLIKPISDLDMINSSFKRELESNSKLAFDELEGKHLIESGIKYHFRSEVGFLLDRIAYNTKNDKIDLLILCDSIFQQVKSSVKTDEKGDFTLFDKPIRLVVT